MFLVAKLITAVDSVLTHLQQVGEKRTPMSKERIFKLLSDIREIGFQAWSTYHTDSREEATEHFIASDDVYVQVNVWSRHAEFHVFSRETSQPLTHRRYQWPGDHETGPVFSCVPVTEKEFRYLKTLGATEKLLPDATSTVYGELIGWHGHEEYARRVTKALGSLERADEIVELMREALVDKLGIAFEV